MYTNIFLIQVVMSKLYRQAVLFILIKNNDNQVHLATHGKTTTYI